MKLTALLTAKPGMSEADFVAYYEDRHAPLIVDRIPFFSHYRRNYVQFAVDADQMPADGSTTPPFSVITEIWYPSADAVKRQVEAMAGEIGETVARDEEQVFDRTRLTMYVTDERVTPTSLLKSRVEGVVGEPEVKIAGLLQSRSGLSKAAFRHQYESDHVTLALQLLCRGGMPLLAGYTRSYVEHDQIFPIGEAPGLTPDFDVLTQLWFWTCADFEAFQELLTEPAIASALADDEERHFDRTSIRSFAVHQRDTPDAQIQASALNHGIDA